MPKTFEQVPQISVGDVEMCAADFSLWLDSGELLTGTPAVTEVTTTHLTIANVAVNTTSLSILGNTAIAGQAVQWKVSGQQAGTTYTVLVSASTDSTPARTVKRHAKFEAV